MMALANCRKCRKLFNKLVRDICEDCLAAEEEQLTVVQHFLRDHPRSSVFQIEEGCGVPASLVMQFAREKRITLVSSEGNRVTCKFCGREIEAGSICKLCQMKLSGDDKRAKIGAAMADLGKKTPPAPERKPTYTSYIAEKIRK
ncbi:hypothetical protein HS125_17535 [bacterium]|nr:hypothetical protein [bacterium]